MASSSSLTSSTNKSFKYDVFISFRGEDTRRKFVSHLYVALKQNGISTYRDDTELLKAEKLSRSLYKRIEDSRLYIIVFSKNYASSSWCLDQLVKIMKCNKMAEHFVCPVFYDVDPTEVRDQSGAVGEAFAIHNNKEEAGKWRDALKEASDLIGWEFMKTANGDKAKIIRMIVEKILLKLHSVDYFVYRLVGMESRIDGFMSLLENILDDVRMIGIKGMGGIGKTTLARAVFRRLAFQFEGASFVDDVREVSRKSGLKKLQKQILSDVFNDEGANVSNVGEWKSMMKRRMCSRKILLVLDDVDQIEQLEALADQPNWFKAGSIIIITTRDEQLLIRHGVNIIHDVKLLSDSEASCLFSRLAFKKDTPVQGYEKHALEVVHYAAGLPLTIEVMGSTLSYREKNIWSSEIKLLKKFPLQQISEKLELSYKSLEDEYKEIFLDVACLLKGCDKERAVRMLESCGFSARIGLRVLEENQ